MTQYPCMASPSVSSAGHWQHAGRWQQRSVIDCTLYKAKTLCGRGMAQRDWRWQWCLGVKSGLSSTQEAFHQTLTKHFAKHSKHILQFHVQENEIKEKSYVNIYRQIARFVPLSVNRRIPCQGSRGFLPGAASFVADGVAAASSAGLWQHGRCWQQWWWCTSADLWWHHVRKLH